MTPIIRMVMIPRGSCEKESFERVCEFSNIRQLAEYRWGTPDTNKIWVCDMEVRIGEFSFFVL
jgi:hypothetical protein